MASYDEQTVLAGAAALLSRRQQPCSRCRGAFEHDLGGAEGDGKAMV